MSGEPAADVPDQALRSALEFAVKVAAVDAKARPRRAFPVELRPLLLVRKLLPKALAQVRTAVESDDEFRRRVGEVANTEVVDEIGVLWLQRPEGWSGQIADLLPPGGADHNTTARREQRRRQATQDAAEARLADLRRERADRAALEVENNRLRGEVDDLRRRLREAQRAENTKVQRLSQVEVELAQARSVVPEPSTPTEPIEPTVTNAEMIRKLIESAASASSDVARLLTAALEEVGPVVEVSDVGPVHPLRKRRPARRHRARLPGGVLAGSVEAAEFVLRAAGAKTLIDGYNVAMLGWPSLDLDHQRERCVTAAENMAKRWNLALTIVFDGAAIDGAHAPTRRRVRIVYSPPGVTADDVLRDEVTAAGIDQPVVVVTNDRAIISDVAAVGADTVSSDAFLALARR